MIIQTIRLDPSEAVWTDGASNLSSLDPSGAIWSDAEHPARNRKVGEILSPLDYVVVTAIKQRGPFPSRLLPVCCPAAGSGTALARREFPARPVTRTLVVVEVRGFEPLASSVRASWG